MDSSCLGEIGPPDPLPRAILLNIITCLISVVIWGTAAWCDRYTKDEEEEEEILNKVRYNRSYGIQWGNLLQYLSVMAITLSLPVLLIFYIADPGSELACQVSILNNVGPLPWGLLTVIIPLILVFLYGSRLYISRYTLATKMIHAVTRIPGPFHNVLLTRNVSILILPAGATRGLFVAPLIRELTKIPSENTDEGGTNFTIHTILADAWDTAWQSHSSTIVLHNLVCEGEQVDNITTTRMDYFGPVAVPAVGSGSLDAIFIPYSKQLTAINSGDTVEDRTIRLLHFLDSCTTALRPGGIFTVGVLRGEVQLWTASLLAVGFTDVNLHPDRIWLSPSPVVILAARLPITKQVSSFSSDWMTSTKSSLPLAPPTLKPPREWFPSGLHWRVRDFTVFLTWIIVALLTWTSCVYLSSLLVPTFVTWGSTVGPLALSSALFGPSCAFYLAIEITKFADGLASPGAYAHGHSKDMERMENGDNDHRKESSDDTSSNRLLAEDNVDKALPMNVSYVPSLPTATEVWSRWLTFELPIFAANIGIFQIVFWLPAFAIDAIVLKEDGRSSTATADNAATGISYGLLGLLCFCGQLWFLRWTRANDKRSMEVVRVATDGN